MDYITPLVEESKKHEVLDALIVFGSFAYENGHPNKDSDIDMYFLISPKESDPAHVVATIVENVFDGRILLKVPAIFTGKMIFYLKDPLFKLDLNYGHSLDKNASILRNSETVKILFSRSEEINKKVDKIMEHKPIDCEPEYQFKYQKDRFIEHFELLCKSIAHKDAYLVEFYSWVLRNALVIMDLIANAKETSHLCRPKKAFEKCSRKEKFPDHLDLNRAGFMEEVEKYLHYFFCLMDDNKVEPEKIESYKKFFEVVKNTYFKE